MLTIQSNITEFMLILSLSTFITPFFDNKKIGTYYSSRIYLFVQSSYKKSSTPIELFLFLLHTGTLFALPGLRDSMRGHCHDPATYMDTILIQLNLQCPIADSPPMQISFSLCLGSNTTYCSHLP